MPPVLVGVFPTYLLVTGIAHFMINHFFVRAPYLLDTGMLSALSYRNGVWLPAPEVALNYVNYYYDVYFSPLTTLFSLLSYLVPVGRLEWYVIIQSAVYAPIGLATYLVASRLEPSTSLRRLPITIVAALAFSFSGLVLWMVGYPHFEAAMPGLTCMTVAALVTGRTRGAWVWLVLAASVRQDGGIHIALALAPVLFLQWRGYERLPSRRTILLMMSVAVGISVTGMLVIKLFFHPYPRLTQAYLGDPLYSHLSVDVVVERARTFLAHSQVIYYPFVATCLFAALRRDAGYMLGWVSTLPWFGFSFLAVEQVKATFFAYGVGPLMIGMFWCYLYGAHLAPARRKMRPAALEAVFALVCLSSTLGLWRAAPGSGRALAHDMAFAMPHDRAAVHGLVDSIRRHKSQIEPLQVDSAVATLALEELVPGEAWPHASSGANTLIFHSESARAVPMSAFAIEQEFTSCVSIRRTAILACSRHGFPHDMFEGIDVDPVPTPFVRAWVDDKVRAIVKFEDRGVVFEKAYVLVGWLGALPRGTYEWSMTFAVDEPMKLDGDELARLEVVKSGSLLSFATAEKDARELTLRFDANGDKEPLAFQFGSRPRTPLTITSMHIRRITVP